MSLFFATLLTAFVLISVAVVHFTALVPTAKFAKGFLRSKLGATIFLSLATAWFCWEILHLGEPDFGSFKYQLFGLFVAISILSHFFVPDFLAVRGLAAFLLLTADALLDAAYMEPPLSRLFLVTLVYLMIIVCMYLGSLPYRLRDFFDWLYKTKARATIFTGILGVYGVLLLGVAFTY